MPWIPPLITLVLVVGLFIADRRIRRDAGRGRILVRAALVFAIVSLLLQIVG